MHTVDLLDHALRIAGKLGYDLRQEWLDGNGGGGCRYKDQKWLFLDLAQSPDEQLDVVLDVLRGEPTLAELPVPQPLLQKLRG
ncbi:MAG: hypothetical protein N2C14_13660 [Planctomycetales bacterium]